MPTPARRGDGPSPGCEAVAATDQNQSRRRQLADIVLGPAQTALAWLLTRGRDIAPIPGTRRVARVEENTAADLITMTPSQLRRLDTLTPAAGDRHDEANMASIDR